MTVTDHHVATVRAFLAGDQDTHQQLRTRLSPGSDRDAYSALLFCAFYEALKRRFGTTATDTDVITFVSELRSRSDQAEQDVYPVTAEHVITNVLKSEPINVDGETIAWYQVVLLAVLVADEAFDDTQLDQFLARSRTLADHMLQAE